VDLNQLIQRAWEEIRAPRVRFTLHGPGVRVPGDRKVLLQALRELLRSAADAAQQSAAPAVTVEVQPGEDEVVLQVHDNGPPMSLADREAVLDTSWGLFTEGPRTGLVRAHRTLAAHGVSLVLPAPRMGGTTARISLPRNRAVRRAAA
jgi:C4-dicarboxylate-specific signal transduction histidine kinase